MSKKWKDILFIGGVILIAIISSHFGADKKRKTEFEKIDAKYYLSQLNENFERQHLMQKKFYGVLRVFSTSKVISNDSLEIVKLELIRSKTMDTLKSVIEKYEKMENFNGDLGLRNDYLTMSKIIHRWYEVDIKKLTEGIYPQIPREELLTLMSSIKEKSPSYDINLISKKIIKFMNNHEFTVEEKELMVKEIKHITLYNKT